MAISQADRIAVFPCFESPVVSHTKWTVESAVERHVFGAVVHFVVLLAFDRILANHHSQESCVDINGGSGSVPLAGVDQLSNGSDGLGWVTRSFGKVRGRYRQVFNGESILPLSVSGILLNHRGVFCVPACSKKEVGEPRVR